MTESLNSDRLLKLFETIKTNEDLFIDFMKSKHVVPIIKNIMTVLNKDNRQDDLQSIK